MSLGPEVWAQPIESKPPAQDELCFSLDDSQGILKKLKENDLLKEKISVLEERVRLLESEQKLIEKESEIKDRLIELAEKKAEIEHQAFERMKEVADRSLKLAEVSQKKFGNLELTGLAAMVAFVAGVLFAK